MRLPQSVTTVTGLHVMNYKQNTKGRDIPITILRSPPFRHKALLTYKHDEDKDREWGNGVVVMVVMVMAQ